MLHHSMNHVPNAFPSHPHEPFVVPEIPFHPAWPLSSWRGWFGKLDGREAGYGFTKGERIETGMVCGMGTNGFVRGEESDRKEGRRANQRGVGKPHNKGTGVCLSGMMRGRYVGCEPPMTPGRPHMTLTEVSG